MYSRRVDRSGQALSNVCFCRESFVIGNSSILSGDIRWLKCHHPSEHRASWGLCEALGASVTISNTERTNPAWGWGCCASLCRSFWIMNYLQSRFKPHSHMDVRHRGFLRTKKVMRAKWKAELNGKGEEGRRCDGSWASHVGVVLLWKMQE